MTNEIKNEVYAEMKEFYFLKSNDALTEYGEFKLNALLQNEAYRAAWETITNE